MVLDYNPNKLILPLYSAVTGEDSNDRLIARASDHAAAWYNGTSWVNLLKLRTTTDLLTGAQGDLARTGNVPTYHDGSSWRNLLTLHASGSVVTAQAGDIALDNSVPSYYTGSAWRSLGGQIDETITFDSNTVGLGVALGTLTDTAQLLRLSATWNDAADAFYGLVMSITETAADAASRLVDLAVGGTTVFEINTSGLVTIGGNPDANMTHGLSIDLLQNEGDILALKSTGYVAHGMTSAAETSTFCFVTKEQEAFGGVTIYGLTEDEVGIRLTGFYTTDNSAKNASANAAIEVLGAKKSGTTTGAMGANANIFAARNNGNTLFILDADGDSHQDVGTAWTNFDDYPDWQLARALKASVVPPDHELARRYHRLVEDYRPLFEAKKIVTYNEDGHHFLSQRNTLFFLMDGLFQTGEKVFVDQEDRIKRLEDRMRMLEVGNA